MTFLKILSLIVSLAVTLIASSLLWARSPSSLLVLDMPDKQEFPKHFRTSSDRINANVNRTGLENLHIAGGGQFSYLAWQKIRQHLHTSNITVIDLRQESHGFLNENAISWYGTANADNADMTDDEILDRQTGLLNKLAQQKSTQVYTDLQKTPTYKIASAKGVKFAVQNVMSEEQLAKKLGFNYHRLFVQDYRPPTDDQVDRFIQIVNHLPANQWVYFHCRAGVGRTTTFMAMYDMLRNAKNVEFVDILKRQAALGGKDLTDMPPASTYKYQYAIERLIFLEKFYEYVQENNDNFKTLWSQWGDD